jgi:DNA mismatch repair protein MutS
MEAGGADRSYGIHVGRLAGLPAPVVARAADVLRLLESEHHVAGRPVPPPPDAAQLALFSGEMPTHPLLDELARLDVDALSPLEALTRLHEWQRQLQENG